MLSLLTMLELELAVDLSKMEILQELIPKNQKNRLYSGLSFDLGETMWFITCPRYMRNLHFFMVGC